LITESLTLQQALDTKEPSSLALDAAAYLAAVRGDPERATRLAAAATTVSTGISAVWVERTTAQAQQRCYLAFDFAPTSLQRSLHGRLKHIRGSMGDATFDAAWAEGRAMTLEQAIAYALEDATEATEQTATPA
jgi:hypothetical protein